MPRSWPSKSTKWGVAAAAGQAAAQAGRASVGLALRVFVRKAMYDFVLSIDRLNFNGETQRTRHGRRPHALSTLQHGSVRRDALNEVSG